MAGSGRWPPRTAAASRTTFSSTAARWVAAVMPLHRSRLSTGHVHGQLHDVSGSFQAFTRTVCLSAFSRHLLTSLPTRQTPTNTDGSLSAHCRTKHRQGLQADANGTCWGLVALEAGCDQVGVLRGIVFGRRAGRSPQRRTRSPPHAGSHVGAHCTGHHTGGRLQALAAVRCRPLHTRYHRQVRCPSPPPPPACLVNPSP